MSNVEMTQLISSLTQSTRSIAKSLAVINPKHSEAYYRDMLGAIIKDCVKKADPVKCLDLGIERLRYQ